MGTLRCAPAVGSDPTSVLVSARARADGVMAWESAMRQTHPIDGRGGCRERSEFNIKNRTDSFNPRSTRAPRASASFRYVVALSARFCFRFRSPTLKRCECDLCRASSLVSAVAYPVACAWHEASAWSRPQEACVMLMLEHVLTYSPHGICGTTTRPPDRASQQGCRASTVAQPPRRLTHSGTPLQVAFLLARGGCCRVGVADGVALRDLPSSPLAASRRTPVRSTSTPHKYAPPWA